MTSLEQKVAMGKLGARRLTASKPPQTAGSTRRDEEPTPPPPKVAEGTTISSPNHLLSSVSNVFMSALSDYMPKQGFALLRS